MSAVKAQPVRGARPLGVPPPRKSFRLGARTLRERVGRAMHQTALALDDLSDELFDMVISDCGGKSLTICIPRVAKRWTAAAARVLACLRHLDARRTPMRPWPLQLTANSIDSCGGIFKTRAQLLAEPGGEAKAQHEDMRLRRKVSERQSDFLSEAFKWSHYLLPEPLRLVRLSSGELRVVSQADYTRRVSSSASPESTRATASRRWRATYSAWCPRPCSWSACRSTRTSGSSQKMQTLPRSATW